MPLKILIDSSYPKEKRIAVIDENNKLTNFEIENNQKDKTLSNIYLAKVVRIEPSLQAAFVDYGEERHGFLPFSEIHPSYYILPQSDRQTTEIDTSVENTDNPSNEETIEAHSTNAFDSNEEDAYDPPLEAESSVEAEIDIDEPNEVGVEPSDLADNAEESDLNTESTEDNTESETGFTSFKPTHKKYKTIQNKPVHIKQKTEPKPKAYQYQIHEVIRKKQILLVQVTKEERGNKGAALTTYLSIPGRYCVLMPNTPNSSGISKKITDTLDRERLKKLTDKIKVPETMSFIVRTAGANKTVLEIKKDFDALVKIWNEILSKTVNSIAPCLIFEEGDIIKKAIRDLYTKEVESIIVEGEEAHKKAKEIMKMFLPSHTKHVKLYKENIPLFHKEKLENQIHQLFDNKIELPSGGSIVIDTSEALTSIDVNSGRFTKEHNIENTALKINTEAAKEIARQLQLRDIGGLIVVDFIDMKNEKNRKMIEKIFHDYTSKDKAKILIHKISPLGLLEVSRQRLKPSLVETHTETCSVCEGRGKALTHNYQALYVLRNIEGKIIQFIEQQAATNYQLSVTARVPIDIVNTLLNTYRSFIESMEQKYKINLEFLGDPYLKTLAPTVKIHKQTYTDPENTILSDEKEVKEVRLEEVQKPNNNHKYKKNNHKKNKEAEKKTNSVATLPPAESNDNSSVIESTDKEVETPNEVNNANESAPNSDDNKNKKKKKWWFRKKKDRQSTPTQ